MGSSRGVVANVLDYDIVVYEFELHPRYYVHFRTNTLLSLPINRTTNALL